MSTTRAAAPKAAPECVGYLLDTSVISALAPGREPHLPAGFAAWLHQRDQRLFVPSIAIAELEQGICKLRRTGAAQRAARLDDWLEALMAGFSERIRPFDAVTARSAGRMSDAATAKGVHPGFADIAIAAIANDARLMLLTRNLKHFKALGVLCADPLTSLPD